MRVGFVGLGKMGSQIVKKLLAKDFEVVVYDTNEEAIGACIELGANGAHSQAELVELLGEKAVLWLMIPAEFVGAEVDQYVSLLPHDSILIDGGNSEYEDSIRRAAQCAERGISFVDVGTSGGVLGLERGFSMMVGGEPDAYNRIKPILHVLSEPEGGYAYIGASGSGHYVKMVHNGIEYALMQAYAEGYDLLKYGPLAGLDLSDIARVWQKGSIVQSNLNGMIADILQSNPELDGIDGYVAASGEGQWTFEAAQKANVGMPALRAALDVRSASQAGKVYFATKLLAAMRHTFGGHQINKP